jgi:hypothetical protein
VTVKDVVPPDPGAMPGSAVMLRLTVVVALSEPQVPVMVTVTAQWPALIAVSGN